MHFDPFEGAHMRSKIGILALLTLAGLAVFTERCACQPAHAKADNEVTVSEPVRVILDRAYVYQAHMFSLSWEEDNTVQVYIDRLPGKYTMKMAVAILPNTRPKSFLVLHEIGWDQRVDKQKPRFVLLQPGPCILELTLQKQLSVPQASLMKK